MQTPPGSDASERFGQAAPPSNTVPPPTPNGLASEARTVVDLRPGFCRCGCGNHTAKHFVPGHNQRLRGELARSYCRAMRVAVRQPLGPPQLVAAPEAADLLGPEWLAWVAPDVEVARATRINIAEVAIADFEAEWEGL